MVRWVKWVMILVLLGLMWAWGIPPQAWAQQKPPLPPPGSVVPPSGAKPSTGPAAAPLGPAHPELPSPKASLPGSVVPPPEFSPYPYPPAERLVPDAKTLIQQRAAQDTAARNRRLAALKWFGYSNSRPVAGVDCIHSDYSPSWTANNPHYPFRWMGIGPAWVAWLPAIPSTR